MKMIPQSKMHMLEGELEEITTTANVPTSDSKFGLVVPLGYFYRNPSKKKKKKS
jgi:hypothetical protein